MKIVGISGSPRKGNSEFLLREALDSAKRAGAETELVLLRGMKIGFCDGCLRCDKTGKCRKKDDMGGIYRKLEESEAILFASPNYYGNMPGLLKNFIDRMNPYYFSEKMKGKSVGIIGVGGDPGGGKEVARIIERGVGDYGLRVVEAAEFVAGNDPTYSSKDKSTIRKARGLGARIVSSFKQNS